MTGGAIGSKLNNYFNTACFTNPSVIGADGIGTGFGDSGTGIVNGPGQANADLALSRSIPIKWPKEGSGLQFRTELFNALNHPQFATPYTNFTSPTFGVISGTAVNPRIIQLALKACVLNCFSIERNAAPLRKALGSSGEARELSPASHSLHAHPGLNIDRD